MKSFIPKMSLRILKCVFGDRKSGEGRVQNSVLSIYKNVYTKAIETGIILMIFEKEKKKSFSIALGHT